MQTGGIFHRQSTTAPSRPFPAQTSDKAPPPQAVPSLPPSVTIDVSQRCFWLTILIRQCGQGWYGLLARGRYAGVQGDPDRLFAHIQNPTVHLATYAAQAIDPIRIDSGNWNIIKEMVLDRYA
jgi:hypothetical protein